MKLVALLALFLALVGCSSEVDEEATEVRTGDATANEPTPTIQRRRVDFTGTLVTEVKLDDLSAPTTKP